MSEVWGVWGENVNEAAQEIPPYFTVEEAPAYGTSSGYDVKDPQSSKLDWLKNAYLACVKESNSRTRLMQALLLAYKGYYDPYFLDRSDSLRDKEVTLTGRLASRKPRRLPVNHMRDLVEQVVSRVTSLPLAIQPFPANNAVLNKNGSLVVKQCLDYLAYVTNEKALLRSAVRTSLVMGEAYVMPVWDPLRGPVSKEYEKAKAEGRKIRRLDEYGKPLKDINGKQVYIENGVRVGDVGYRCPLPIDVFLAPDNFYMNQPEWFMWREYVHVDKLRSEFSRLSGDIKATPDLQFYNFNTLDFTKTKSWCLKVHFYHRRTPDLPDGKYICFTPDVILTEADAPYPIQDDQEFGELPLVRLTGFDIMGELHGTPNVIDIAALQHCYNQLTTIGRRNAYMGTTPHWVYPKGSVESHALLNVPTRIEYPPGLDPPKLLAAQLLGGDFFQFRNDIKGEMEQLIGVYGVSRGDPPPNTRSAEQLSFYEEQQQQKASGPVAKYSEFYLGLKRKTLAIIADNYENDDERMRLLIGEDQEPIIEPFDIKVLSQPWNIRLTQVSSLSQSPSVRMQQLLTIRQQFGDDILTAEQFADLTQFGQVEKVYSLIGLAVKSAEMENQLAAENKEIPDPQAFEELIVHWRTHVKYMNSPGFQRWDSKQQQRLKDHVLGTEYLMWKLMMKNPGFGQRLLMLTGWPAFMVLPDQESMTPQQVLSPTVVPPPSGVIPPGATLGSEMPAGAPGGAPPNGAPPAPATPGDEQAFQ